MPTSRFSRFIPLLLLLLPLGMSAVLPLAGRWHLDPARSTALDGWTAWDLVVVVDGSRVSLRHDMQWRTTKQSATNTVDTAQPSVVTDFFRVEQRHMALYPAKGGTTRAERPPSGPGDWTKAAPSASRPTRPSRFPRARRPCASTTNTSGRSPARCSPSTSASTA